MKPGMAACPRYSWLDFLFTITGLCTYVLDVGSDLLVAREFLLHGDLLWFGLLLGLLLASSITVQLFSWCWFKYDLQLEGFQSSPKAVLLFGSSGRYELTRGLHLLQLGFLCRQISAIWQGFCVWWRRTTASEYAVYMTHDLSMLRLIETFCESTPQLTLMIYIMIHNNHGRTLQYVSAIASAVSIAWMVVDYHRSLRFFLFDKNKQTWLSSVVYFLWNLFLIGPRVVCVSLFATVLPCYVIVHFVVLWAALTLWACLQGTSFMDDRAGEWLYRTTVGVIWYFSWFNVVEGRTRDRSFIYHSFIVLDGAVLLLTWWCFKDTQISHWFSCLLLLAIALSYLIGLLVKILYYCCFHPKLMEDPEPPKGDVTDGLGLPGAYPSTGSSSLLLLNRRMKQHAVSLSTFQPKSPVI